MKRSQTASTPKPEKKRRKDAQLARAQLRAPAEEVASWMTAAAREGRSLNSWLRRIANEAVRVVADAE